MNEKIKILKDIDDSFLKEIDEDDLLNNNLSKEHQEKFQNILDDLNNIDKE